MELSQGQSSSRKTEFSAGVADVSGSSPSYDQEVAGTTEGIGES